MISKRFKHQCYQAYLYVTITLMVGPALVIIGNLLFQSQVVHDYTMKVFYVGWCMGLLVQIQTMIERAKK